MESITHFGITLQNAPKYGHKLTRERYAIINKKSSFIGVHTLPPDWYEDSSMRIYCDEWCKIHREKCLINFDWNMRFFSTLDSTELEYEIQRFLKKFKGFKSVDDLDLYNGKHGYYLLVLDEYSRVYIGTSDNIKQRIKNHWIQSCPFDRLLFHDQAGRSFLSIDSFRALDTTRIFVYLTEKTFEFENEYINFFSSKFIGNRISGGKPTTEEINRLWLKLV